MKEKEEKRGFLQSFTGKFKKVSLEDEPDELMMKYGDIKLKDPSSLEEEGENGIHAPKSSFFFSKETPGEDSQQDLGTTREINGLLEALESESSSVASETPQEKTEPLAEKNTRSTRENSKIKPIGVTQEVNGILEALGRANVIAERETEPEPPKAARTETPETSKRKDFSQAFEEIKNQKAEERGDTPQYRTQEIARIISEVTGEQTEMIRPVELTSREEEAVRREPEEEELRRTDSGEDPVPEEPLAEYEYSSDEDFLEEDIAPKPKREIGKKLKAFFKNLVTLPEAQQGEDPFAEDDFTEDDLEKTSIGPAGPMEDMEEEEDYSIRPELFYQDDEEEAADWEEEENITENAAEEPELKNEERKPQPKELLDKKAPAGGEEEKEEAGQDVLPDAQKASETVGLPDSGAEENAEEAPGKEDMGEKASSNGANEEHSDGEAAAKADREEADEKPEKAPDLKNSEEVSKADDEAETSEDSQKEANAAAIAKEKTQAEKPLQMSSESEDKPKSAEKEAASFSKQAENQKKRAEKERPLKAEQKPASRYEQAFGKVKPAAPLQKKIIRVDPDSRKLLTPKEGAKLYWEHRGLSLISLPGESLEALLEKENAEVARVTILPSKKETKKPSLAADSLTGAQKTESQRQTVQSVTVNLADVQASRKLKHHENTRLFHYEPQVPVIYTAAGKFGENLKAECAVSRQALQKQKEEHREQTVSSLEEEELPEVGRKKKLFREKIKKRGFAIFSSQEEVDPEDVIPAAEPIKEVDDYTDPSDAYAVNKEIFKSMKNLLLRSVVLAALMVLSLAVTVMARLNLPHMPDVFLTNSPLYLGVSLFFLIAAGAVSLTALKNGFLSVARLKGNSDAPAAFAWAAVVIQIIVGFFSAGRFVNTDLSIYANLAVLALLLNSWGKLLMVRRTRLNFKFVCSPDEKYAAKIYNDRETAVDMCRGLGAGEPVIAYQKKTGFLSNFLQLSYEPDPSEKFAGKISFLGAGLSLILGVVSFLLTKDIFAAVSAFALSMCVCVPMSSMLVMNFSMFCLCKKAAKLDAMLIGYPGVRQFADTSALVLDCNTLFPANTVVLHEVKAFETRLLDKALLEAAAMLRAAKSPLYHVFEQIVGGDQQLPMVDSVSYEDERGLMGWVHGKRILVGNRALLENHGVTPPDRSVELEHTQAGRQITYIATAGELAAMLVTGYDFSGSMKQELQRLEDNGVAFLISTSDPNITAKLVSDRFGLFFRSVKVLSAQYAKEFKNLEAEEPSGRAYLATGGRLNVLARMLAACIRVRGNMTAALVLQRLTVLITFFMVAFLTVISGVAQIGALEVTLYSIFWVIVTLLVSMIRKP